MTLTNSEFKFLDYAGGVWKVLSGSVWKVTSLEDHEHTTEGFTGDLPYKKATGGNGVLHFTNGLLTATS